jgi:hypothetical protein
MLLLIMHPHGPTHNNQKIKLLRRRENIASKQTGTRHLDPFLPRPALNAAQPFKINMLQPVHSHDSSAFFVSVVKEER